MPFQLPSVGELASICHLLRVMLQYFLLMENQGSITQHLQQLRSETDHWLASECVALRMVIDQMLLMADGFPLPVIVVEEDGSACSCSYPLICSNTLLWPYENTSTHCRLSSMMIVLEVNAV